MCMSLLDIILVFLFLYMYTILQRQCDQFQVSLLIIHLIKVVRQVYAYIHFSLLESIVILCSSFSKAGGPGYTSLVHEVS